MTVKPRVDLQVLFLPVCGRRRSQTQSSCWVLRDSVCRCTGSFSRRSDVLHDFSSLNTAVLAVSSSTQSLGDIGSKRDLSLDLYLSPSVRISPKSSKNSERLFRSGIFVERGVHHAR